MIPASTRNLAAAACALVALWFWAWIAAEWKLPIPADNQLAPSALLPTAVPLEPDASSSTGREIDASALLRFPAFYPDRLPHPFRPDALSDQPVQATEFDYQLTTTVIGKKHAFAMLRLPGSNQSLLARLGEPFEGDPSWHVTGIDNVSIQLAGIRGREVRLALKPLTPVQPPASVPPIPMPQSQQTTGAMSLQSMPAPPAYSIQPAQGNAELRARIEARRHEAAASASAARTQ